MGAQWGDDRPSFDGIDWPESPADWFFTLALIAAIFAPVILIAWLVLR